MLSRRAFGEIVETDCRIAAAIAQFDNLNFFVRDLLFKAIDETDNILKNPTPVIRLEEFGVNGFVFLVRGFISSEKTLDQWDIASNARFAIVKILRSNGIELSFPVQIIHLKNDQQK